MREIFTEGITPSELHRIVTKFKSKRSTQTLCSRCHTVHVTCRSYQG